MKQRKSVVVDVFSSAMGSEHLGSVCASVILTFFIALFTSIALFPVRWLTETVHANSGSYSESEILLQPLWSWLVNDCGSVTSHAAFPGAMTLVFYFIGALPFCMLDWLEFDWIRQFRLRGEDRPPSTRDDWYKTLAHTGYNIIFFILPGVTWQFISQGPWMYSGPALCFHSCDGRALLPSKAPPLMECALHVLLSLLVFDTLYWYWHKCHHEERRLYKHIHGIHHNYHAPFVFVTQYAHPAEILALSVFSMFVPIFMGAHPLSQWIWLIVSVQLSLDAHAGYNLPISIDKILPFLGLGGAIHHDLHHQWPRTNFQPFFTWHDHWCGTDFESSSECNQKKEHTS